MFDVSPRRQNKQQLHSRSFLGGAVFCLELMRCGWGLKAFASIGGRVSGEPVGHELKARRLQLAGFSFVHSFS